MLKYCKKVYKASSGFQCSRIQNTMYVTPILLLLLASNAFAVGNEDWQALFSSLGINTNEISCVVQNFKVNLDTLMSLANKQQNEVKPEASGDGNTPELTPLAGDCQTYYKTSTLDTFWGAYATCSRSGMKFATPNTGAKFQCLRDALKQGTLKYDYWIGATNTNRPFYYWVTTNEIADIGDKWAGNPSGSANRCIYISAVDGLIRDDICTNNNRRYICESA